MDDIVFNVLVVMAVDKNIMNKNGKKLFLIEVIPWGIGWATPHRRGNNCPEREDSIIYLVKAISWEKAKEWLKKAKNWKHGDQCYVRIKEAKIIEI